MIPEAEICQAAARVETAPLSPSELPRSVAHERLSEAEIDPLGGFFRVLGFGMFWRRFRLKGCYGFIGKLILHFRPLSRVTSSAACAERPRA